MNYSLETRGLRSGTKRKRQIATPSSEWVDKELDFSITVSDEDILQPPKRNQASSQIRMTNNNKQKAIVQPKTPKHAMKNILTAVEALNKSISECVLTIRSLHQQKANQN
jgi:hypothetical protein